MVCAAAVVDDVPEIGVAKALVQAEKRGGDVAAAEARAWCAEGGWALLAYSVSAGKLRAATEEDDGLAASVAYLQWLEGDAQSAPAIFILP